jgi:predicted O-methyltransferase YrrM
VFSEVDKYECLVFSSNGFLLSSVMNPVLKDIVETGFCKGPGGEPIKLEYQVPPEVGGFLHAVVTEIKPAVSLEVGLAFGISAMFICDGLERTPRARHIVIDPGQHQEPFKGLGLSNLEKAGYKSIIDFRQQPSHLALPRLEEEGCKVDFAFIDGIHSFDHTLVDFFHVDRILRVGGIVAFDDCYWASVRKVCRFIARNRAYSVFRCSALTSAPHLSWQHRVLDAVARRIGKVQDVLKPDFLVPDIQLGLPPTRCIAFRKERDDDRHWTGDDHRDF